ncbi:MAG: phenylacetate--CoA ligase family protein [Leptospirales bacterium]|nr:phenylacetate--CoA ligase family protein [Leptospirales bacterium]
MRRFSLSEYLRAAALAGAVAPGYLIRPYLGRKHIERFQYSRIKRLLHHAYERSPFYREKYANAGIHPNDFRSLRDLAFFPCVTKGELVDAIEAGALPGANRFIESVSSGSSGKVIRVSHDVKDTHAYAVGRYRILNMLGNYRPMDRTLYVYTSEFPARSFFGFYRSWFVSTLNDINDTIDRMLKLRPHVLCIYPSHLLELIRHISSAQAQSLRLKLISLNSEMSSRSQRKMLSEYFGCPVLDEYSSEELGWVATECQHGTYHVWEDMAYLETLDRASGARRISGEITGTNLHNFATPFIRYRQGDMGSLSEGLCMCGRKTLQLDGLLGRQNDSFLLDGQTLTPAYLLDTVYEMLLVDRLPIADFCLIQESPSAVRMQIIPAKNAGPDLELAVSRGLARFLPSNTRIEIEVTDKLLKTRTGKRNPIISAIGKR